MTSNPLQQCCNSSSDMNIRPQRTMSEPARNASVLLAEALKPGASLDQITLALEAILAVTAKGLGGDASAYAQYQALLLE
ncbi:hypothetical protein JEV27_11910, partial [Pseudomonas aeruginosa]|nr:hypothetical protein [Pseudomonas aeruginosa]